MHEPPVLLVAPFVLLLAAIALMPFLARHWWEQNFHRVSVGLGVIVAAYYMLVLHNAPRMLTTAVEYAGFIALIGSLFVIAGGIHINMSGRATPAANVSLLALGAVLSNLIGTTGASMLLIRPFLRINKYRVAPFQVVFFIFIVSNTGGALTPIGDPPLFLGYLKGVPFFWLLTNLSVVLVWLLTVGLLLALFYVFDVLSYRRHKPAAQEETRDRIELEGAHNFIWLVFIIGLVLVQKADVLKQLEHFSVFASLGERLGWGPQMAAETFTTAVIAGLMIGVACLAHRFASEDALKENEFSFGPVREVAFLFVGIFATMVPALELLEHHAGDLGIATVRQFYWGSGALSAVLDNAPTYLNFLTAAFGLKGLSLENPVHVQQFLTDPALSQYIMAVSLGSVFFGACTYIGNGPNFMVKSIAESAGVKCPSFFGYVFKYSLPILIPIFALVAWLFPR